MIQDDNEDDDTAMKKERKAFELERRRDEVFKVAANKLRLRQLHLERKEKSQAEELQRAKEASEFKVRQIELGQRLAKELSHCKFNELQDTFKKLKARAKVSLVSSCDAECLETKIIEERKQEENLQSSKSVNIWYLSDDLRQKQQHEKKLKYKRELQNQLIANRRRQREEEEEKHRERKIIEEIGETIRKENLEAANHKKETNHRVQAEREYFLKVRQFWKSKRREMLKQEHETISRMIAEKETLQRKEAEKKSENVTTKGAMVDKLTKVLEEKERKRIEREEICRELYLAEKESERANEVIRLALNKKRTAKEMLQEMERHQKLLADKKAKEYAVDAAFARHLAEEQKKLETEEKHKEEARRKRVFQYGNELRETIRRNRMEHLKNVSSRKSEPAKNEGHETKEGECINTLNANNNVSKQSVTHT